MPADPKQPRDVSIADRRFFTLDDATFNRFTAALDKPPAENRKLRRLLISKSPWER